MFAFEFLKLSNCSENIKLFSASKISQKMEVEINSFFSGFSILQTLNEPKNYKADIITTTLRKSWFHNIYDVQF